MGTNYYLVKKLDEDQMGEAISLLISQDYQVVEDLLTEEIHIGKSSAGWEFIFNHHHWKYFGKSKKSVEDFLKSGTIYSEYRETLSPEEFWEKVEGKRKGNYSTEHSSKINGLVFSKYTDFS